MSTAFELADKDTDSEGNGVEGFDRDDPVRKQTTTTAIGKTKTFAGLNREEWIFIILSVVNVLIVVGFTIVRMTQLTPDTADFTFAIIVLINAAFCILYAIHGVLREREFEIYAYIAAIAVVLAYVIINLINNPTKRSAVKWTRFGAILLFAPFNIYYGIAVARGFGFLEFKTVGAAVTLQKMYRVAGIFSCLLKFDFQLAVSLTVFVIYNPLSLALSDKIIVGVGVPFQFFWSVLGWIMLRKELRYLAWVFIPASLVEPGYIIYRLEVDIKNWTSKDGTTNTTMSTAMASTISSTSASNASDKDTLVYCCIVIAVVALLVRIFVLVTLKFVVANFGKGLRESVYSLPVSDDQPPLLPRKRDIAKCCGIVCCGPLG